MARLAKKAKINVPDDMIDKLNNVTLFNFEVRYPDYKNSFYEKCTHAYTKEKLEMIKEVKTWLKSEIKK